MTKLSDAVLEQIKSSNKNIVVVARNLIEANNRLAKLEQAALKMYNGNSGPFKEYEKEFMSK